MRDPRKPIISQIIYRSWRSCRADSLTGEDKLYEPCSVTAVETVTQGNEDHDSVEQDNCVKIVEESAQDESGISEDGSVRAQDEAENPQKIGSAGAQDEAEDPQEVGLAACAVKDKIGFLRRDMQEQEAGRDGAHSLYGRLYKNRIVKVEYVSKELHHIRFPSG